MEAGKRQTELFNLPPLPEPDGEDDGDRLTLRKVAALIGEDGALELQKAFGGRRLYLPAFPGERHVLSRCIGTDRAEQLCARHGGEYLELPILKGRYERIRERREIIKLRAHGHTVTAIAGALRCSERHVRKVLNQR